MRFRFCGDLECPDWILCEIALLSNLDISSIRLIIQQILISSLEGTFDHEKVVQRLLKNKQIEILNLKGMIICIHFIIIDAAKYDVDDISLIREIQQLGLPIDTAELIGHAYQEYKEQLQHHLTNESYRVSRLLSTEWKVVHASNHIDTKNDNSNNDNNNNQSSSASTTEEGRSNQHNSVHGNSNMNSDNQSKIFLKMQVDINPNGSSSNNLSTTKVIDSMSTTSLSALASELQRKEYSCSHIKELSFEISSDKLDLLIHELSMAYSTMQDL